MYKKGVMPVPAPIRSGKVPLAGELVGAWVASAADPDSRRFGCAAGTFPGTSVSALWH